MARTRVIYQGEALYCSQDVAYNVAQTGTQEGAGVTSTPDNFNIKDLNRVQSVNYSFNVARQDVNQFGELAAIDQCIVEAPTVSLDASYYLADFTNEHRLGLYVTQSGEGTKYGGANSHMAIRCAEFGIPAAIGCGEQRYEQIVKSNNVHLDCATGMINIIN